MKGRTWVVLYSVLATGAIGDLPCPTHAFGRCRLFSSCLGVFFLQSLFGEFH